MLCSARYAASSGASCPLNTACTAECHASAYGACAVKLGATSAWFKSVRSVSAYAGGVMDCAKALVLAGTKRAACVHSPKKVGSSIHARYSAAARPRTGFGVKITYVQPDASVVTCPSRVGMGAAAAP